MASLTTENSVRLVGEIRARTRKDYAHIAGEDGKLYFAHIARVRGQKGEIISLNDRDAVLAPGTAVVFSYFPGDVVEPGKHPLAFDIRARK